LLLDQSTVADNTSQGYGGGIAIFQTPTTIQTSIISGNKAISGGGVYGYDSTLTVESSLIADNVAIGPAGLGGGVALRDSSVKLHNSRVTGNLAGKGGGLYSAGNYLRLENCTVSGNAAEDDGGGIFNHNTLVVKSTTVSDNRAGRDGGGIWSSGQLPLNESTIARNTAGHDGGGVWLEVVGDTAKLTQSTISTNTAGNNGGGVWLSNSKNGFVTVAHSTVVLNAAGGSGLGGGLFVFQGPLTIDQSIVAKNDASAGPDLTGLFGATFAARFSLIGDNANTGLAEAHVRQPDANGNLVGGPMLGPIDPMLGPLTDNGGPAYTHALLVLNSFTRSPAIDAGDPTAIAGMNNTPQFDQRGMPYSRVFDGDHNGSARIDIGAIETQPYALPKLLGDYNEDGVVDAADYTLWRDSLGASVGLYQAADGSGNSVIDIKDYYVWTDHFGQTLAGGGANSLPLSEPAEPLVAAAASEIGIPQATEQVEPLSPGPIIVTTLTDTVNLSDGLTSLREAIFAANIVPGADTINFAPALTASGPAKILLTQGELKITDSLTINGSGADLLTIDASGSDPTPGVADGKGSRIFNIDNGQPFYYQRPVSNVTISGMTLTGGETGFNYYGGGAIFSFENLSVIGCDVRGNSSLSLGGGISSAGNSISIEKSIIRDNVADGPGGGIGGGVWGNVSRIGDSVVTGNYATIGAGLYITDSNATIDQSEISGNGGAAFGGGIFTDAILKITNSTISGNAAKHGGGLYNLGNVTITGSTLSSNTASGRGGAIANVGGRIVILYSTLTENQAADGQGGGVATRYNRASVEVTASIIAGNGTSDFDSFDGAQFISHGYNVTGTGNSATAFDQPSDQIGVTDPKLNPLADNGGFLLPDGSHILTRALLPGSPAINAGDPSALPGTNGAPAFDERGTPFGRIFGGRIDIGAVEYQPNPLPGDFNFNGIVDAADYTVWRDTLGSTTDLRADATGTGGVNQLDYEVWKENFGNTLGSTGAGSVEQGVNGEMGIGSGDELRISDRGLRIEPRIELRGSLPPDSPFHLNIGTGAAPHPALGALDALREAVSLARDEALLAWLAERAGGVRREDRGASADLRKAERGEAKGDRTAYESTAAAFGPIDNLFAGPAVGEK
jgi:hypothetical protein